MKLKVLVTGGMGYIGSHTCVQMLERGIEPIIIDNLSNSNREVLHRIEAITSKKTIFYQADVRDERALDAIFSENNICAVLHFAGLKAVGESVTRPLAYYDNNVTGSLVLARAMKKANVKTLLFSSSATVYGEPKRVPITEESRTGETTSPYGTSKYMVELCLRDLSISESDWSITLLRYFNPVGAHPSGSMGEDPQGTPNNLMPFIAQVAVGRRDHLCVFGDDYPTLDGTGVRDYVHVMDLAEGHIKALQVLKDKKGLHIYNLGSGHGNSVLEILNAFSLACGKTLPYKICARRAGDVAAYWASTEKAARDLNWKASKTPLQMAEDTWRWQSNNPFGYTRPL